jgi:hypothetical protein
MNLAPHRSRLLAATALLPATLAVVLALWSLGVRVPPGSGTPARHGSAPAAVALVGDQPGGGGRLVLRVDGERVTVSLDDTPPARAFAAMLPLQLTLRDPMGQAKSGRLPSPLPVADAVPVTDPSAGGVYYWPPTHTVAVFYDDLGQSVPSPGLVRLGVVDDGLDAISGSGNTLAVQLDRSGPQMSDSSASGTATSQR